MTLPPDYAETMSCPQCSEQNPKGSEYCWKCYFDLLPNKSEGAQSLSKDEQFKGLRPIYGLAWVVFVSGLILWGIQGFVFGNIAGFTRGFGRGTGLPFMALGVGGCLLCLDKETFKSIARYTILVCTLSFSTSVVLALDALFPNIDTGIKFASASNPAEVHALIKLIYSLVSPIICFWFLFEKSRLKYLTEGMIYGRVETILYQSRKFPFAVISFLGSIFGILIISFEK